MTKSNFLEREIKRPFSKTICFMFFVYWFVLVVWQNLGGAGLRGAADTIVKCVLLLLLCWAFFSRSTKVKPGNLLWILLFTATQMVTFVVAERISFYIVVTYFYTPLFLLLTYGVGNAFEIDKNELITFFRLIIAVVLYTILYTLIADIGQYRTALSATNGYGNEFHSFFVSNNEFAMYCFFGMVAVVLLMDSRIKAKGRVCLQLIATTFLVHVVLSFSRVTMVCSLLFLLAYVMFYRKTKSRKWITMIFAVLIGVWLCSEEIRRFLFEVAFKSADVESRETLGVAAMEFYSRGSWLEKFFGFGIHKSRTYLEETATYGSVHNGYIQVLLYYGIVGLAWMVGMLVSQIVAGFRIIRTNKFAAALSIGLVCVAAANMVTSTQIIFTSPIDSFFVTAMFIVVPKYVQNAAKNNEFSDVF